MNWDLATDIILYASFVALGIFIILGLSQWISRKSLKKVDRPLLYMIIPLILMVLVYLLCDKVLPHFLDMPTRPDGSGEPSFPSTHVMVVGTIFCLIAGALPYYLHSRALCALIWTLMAVLMTLCAVGRIAANKHSLADVLGGLGFAFIFAVIYTFVLKKFAKSKSNQPAKKEQHE